jgi:hypothetical protein
MKPLSGLIYSTMSLDRELLNLRNRIKAYQIKPDAVESYLLWMQQLERAITAKLEEIEMDEEELRHMYELQIQDLKRQLDQNYEVIKKLGLIIDAAGIEFPTIHQSLPAIQNYYLQAKGLSDKINSFDPHSIKVSL